MIISNRFGTQAFSIVLVSLGLIWGEPSLGEYHHDLDSKRGVLQEFGFNWLDRSAEDLRAYSLSFLSAHKNSESWRRNLDALIRYRLLCRTELSIRGIPGGCVKLVQLIRTFSGTSQRQAARLVAVLDELCSENIKLGPFGTDLISVPEDLVTCRRLAAERNQKALYVLKDTDPWRAFRAAQSSAETDPQKAGKPRRSYPVTGRKSSRAILGQK